MIEDNYIYFTYQSILYFMVRIFLISALFLMPIYAPIIVIGGLLGLNGVLAGLLLSLIVYSIIVLNVDRLIIYAYRAHQASPDETAGIREKLMKISNSAGVANPMIYYTELPLPGSFIIGRNTDMTKLVVPKRLFDLLKDDELEAALAYNIAQVDENIFLRTFSALISGVLTITASAVRWCAVYTGFGDYDEPAPMLLEFFALGIVAPPAATIVHLAAMQRDYDKKACALGGKPDALISAIDKLENSNVRGYPSLGFICLIDSQKENFYEQLFDVHPSREIRFENLSIQGENLDRTAS